MFFPWNTDAAIYHWPVATVGLIVVNVLTLALVLGGIFQDPDVWCLQYGDGLHPLQWITSNFLHEGVMHLFGNMVFLWSFGLIVEGKIGWWRFLIVYLGIGVVQCAGEQTLTQQLMGQSLGASAILFGLVAMACVWAPRNDLHCIGLLGMRTFTFDVSVLNFALFYIIWEAVMAAVDGFAVGSALLHLSGALVGFVVGAAMVKLNLVDCENWDLFSVLAGREGQTPEKSEKELEEERERRRALQVKREAEIIGQVRRYVADSQPRAALEALHALRQQRADFNLPESELVALIRALERDEAWEQCVPMLVEYLRRFPEKAVRARLNLAQILIQRLERPAQALRVLAKLPPTGLPEPLDQARQKLIKVAQRQRDAGSIELGAEDW